MLTHCLVQNRYRKVTRGIASTGAVDVLNDLRTGGLGGECPLSGKTPHLCNIRIVTNYKMCAEACYFQAKEVN